MKEYISYNSVFVASLVLVAIIFSFLNYGHNAQCICYGEKFDVYNQPNSNISQVCYDVCTNGHYYLKNATCEYNEDVVFGATAVWSCGL